MSGPLEGIRVIELAGLGPGPFGAMMLADLGADVIRVDRVSNVDREGGHDPRLALLHRGRRSIALDVRLPAGRDTLLRLLDDADVLIEGFRPGVMERLGLGPDVCLPRNAKLVYGRMTGWGQEGPLAGTAGHDINYIAIAGALRNFAREGERPLPPLSLIGDMGGGGMLLALGVVCGVLEARASGRGQVVDVAMVDGVASLMTMFYAFLAQGRWEGPPGTNFSDTGAPDYEVYETADGQYMAVGALEPQFYSELLLRLDLDEGALPPRSPDNWDQLKGVLTACFARRTRDEWTAVFEGSDACCFPVLTMAEAAAHPHLRYRSTFDTERGPLQPAPAPRFAETPGALSLPPSRPGEHSRDVLAAHRFEPDEIEELLADGAVAQARPEV